MRRFYALAEISFEERIRDAIANIAMKMRLELFLSHFYFQIPAWRPMQPQVQ